MLHIPEDPVHPGRILFDDFLEDYGLAIDKVAADTGIVTEELSDIRDGKAGITAEIALRLSRYFSNSPEFWLNLQRAYDLSLAQKTATGLDRIQPVHAA
jgi:addiction module HigA family antidote